MVERDRKIAAIFAADVVGYSRLMQLDEAATLADLQERRRIFDRLVGTYGGRDFGSVGDSLMAEFPSAVNAVLCAGELQALIRALNQGAPADRRMELRVGVNLGDVVRRDDRLYGDGVNVAARLQAIAPPGGVLVSRSVYEQVKGKVEYRFSYLGERRVKNLAEPISTYLLIADGRVPFVERLRELYGGKVLHAALAYAVCAGLAFAAARYWLPRFDAPPWSLRALLSALVLCFVPTLLLTARRARRRRIGAPTSSARGHSTRWLLTAGLLPIIAAPLWWIWSYDGTLLAVPPPGGTPKRVPLVAVAPVQNLTGRAEVEWLGVGLANLVRDRLAQSKYLRTVSRAWWDTIAEGTTDEASVRRHASAADIDYVLFGELLASPTGFILTHRVSNLRDGSEVAAPPFEGLDESDVISAAYRLTILAKQALGVPFTEQIDSYAADFAVQHLGAYQAYLSGLRYHREWRVAEAIQSMNAALKLAPEFHMARYRLAMIKNATGSTSEAVELMHGVPKDAPMGRRERLYIDAATAFFSQDFASAIATYRRLHAEFPNEIEARQRLAEVYFHIRDDDAAIAELRFLGELEPQNEEVWNQLTAYLIFAGRLEEAVEANRMHRKIAPRRPHPLTLEGDILRDRGELAAALARYEKALQIDCDFPPAVLGHAQIKAMQGQVAEAVALYRTIVVDERIEVEERLTAALNLAALLRARGEFPESSQVLVDMQPLIEQERIRVAMALALRARNAFDAGDRRAAMRLVQESVSHSPEGGVPTRYLFTMGLLEALAGDRVAARATANKIRESALPPENPDRAEEKAALYLEGLLELEEGRPQLALTLLQRSVDLGGYRYAIYEIDLARALVELGRPEEGEALLAKAVEARDPGDPRFDLEPDRARASRLRTAVAEKLGRREQAAHLASEFQLRWTKRAAPAARTLADCKSTV